MMADCKAVIPRPVRCPAKSSLWANHRVSRRPRRLDTLLDLESGTRWRSISW